MSPISTDVCSSQYDVFLSFRGSDTRKAFANHLYHSLIKAGTVPVCVFKDDNSIPIGEKFDSKILDAITRSKISIPIISENYGSSKWCLRELIHIMDCKKRTSHVVLPIFYKVDPSDVRYQKGSFGEAFHLRKKHFDEMDIQEGLQALREVSDLHGWESEKFANGHEGELVEKVVKNILSKLQQDFQLDVTKHLVGIGDHVNKIKNWVDTPASVARMIGIYGMGGIGKTTLAKEIYNQLLNDFVHHSFLADIRETAYRHGIPHLQKQLIKTILQDEPNIWNVDDGISLIKSRFKGKKVLILLDDVDDKNQLDVLAREHNWFVAGSLIIVTTRNKAILDQSEFEVDFKYELTELDKVQALLLFNKHAFCMDYPPRDFDGISRDIISTMGGLPLALKVVGSYLYKKTNPKVWEDVLKQLENQPHRDVQKILQISYDALEDGHKQIFLDIACFFIGKTSKYTLFGEMSEYAEPGEYAETGKYAMYMWEDCQYYPNQGIEELKLRCLIEIGDRGEFLVHDQLRDLGRSIFCQGQSLELEKRTGPWDNDYKGVSRVIRQRERSMYDILRASFYDTSRAAASGTSNDKLLYEVRWLEWAIDGGHSYLPPINFHLPNLSVLMLSTIGFTQDWTGWSSFMASKQLKILVFKYTPNLRSTPDLSAFTQLKILDLSRCWVLEHLHTSIGKLTSLVSLDLSHCDHLKKLPQEVGKLKDLEELLLSGTGIIEIPTFITSLRKLKKLIANHCRSLRKIPRSIRDLQNLQHLHLSYSAIKELPSAIGDLQNLRHLDLSFSRIKKLPSAIGSLRKLEKLGARSCRSLREIPSSVGDLQNLQHLDLNWSAIEKLPSGIGDLHSLQILRMVDTPISDLPESIRNLSSLQSLQLQGCDKHCSLPELPLGLTNLGVCCQSPTLPQLSSLIHLKELWLDRCHLFEDIPELSSRLLKLTIHKCDKLILLKLDRFEYLEDFDMRDCSFIERLDLSCLNHLKKLKVEDCNNLVEIQGPYRAKSLPDLNGCQRLQYFSIKNCKKLTQLRGFEKLDLNKSCLLTHEVMLPQQRVLYFPKLLDLHNRRSGGVGHRS